MTARAAAAAIAGALGFACSVPGLDLSGKQCPCADGFACDATGGECLPLGGAIAVGELEAVWTTPNQIRWAWQPTGSAAEFREYQIVVAESAGELETRSGTARVFTPRENPELGTFELPRVDVAERTWLTTTDLLEPATSYFGQLIAIDTAGRAAVSEVVSARTTDPPISTIAIFDDDLASSSSLPPQYAPSATAPFRGDTCYLYTAAGPCPETCSACCADGTLPECSCAAECNPCCAPGDSACGENLRFNDLQLSLAAIGSGSFDTTAFLEFAIALDADVPAYWSEAFLWFGNDTTPAGIWTTHPLTFRNDGEYRLIQVPLRALGHYAVDNGIETVSVPLPYCQLDPDGDPPCAGAPPGELYAFAVGGTWTVGAEVRIDAVRIGY